jgi:hypothetical protein
MNTMPAKSEIRGDDLRITIERNADGWEVRQELNSLVVHLQRFTDWHRVERAVQAFEQAKRIR